MATVNFTEFTELITNIKKECELIAKQCFALAKALKIEDNEIIEAIQDSHKTDSKETIKIKIEEFLVSQTEDAKSFLREFDKFFVVKERGFLPDKTCDFLYPIWMGDMYGEKGVDALRELFESVKNQYKSILKRNLISNYPYE